MTYPAASRVSSAAGWRRTAARLLGLLLAATALQASAQQDPPGRVGSLGYQQGVVTFSPAGDDQWYDALPNRPLTTGDRLWTDPGARAELSIGSTALRLDAQTAISLDQLDDSTARITATQGQLQLRVRDDLAGQRLEVDTPNFAVVINAPGDYRIDTDPAAGTSHLAVAAGQATLFGDGGESLPMGAHQQLTTTGRNLAAANGAPVRAATGFDRWVADRDRDEDQSVAARYVSRDVVGYQALDGNGDWQTDPTYGEVWFPHDTDSDWAPYSDGQWIDVAPWGWTWVDAAPWGFATAHYGRWARIGPRWAWVPGPPHARPFYSPALVGFVGGAAGAGLALGGGRNGVGWFPLAPGETWQPGYRASQRYVEQANQSILQRQAVARNAGFVNQQANAVTVVPSEQFGRGPIGRQNVLRLPPTQLAGVPVAMAAPVPPHGERGVSVLGRPVANAPPAAGAPPPQMRQPPLASQPAARQFPQPASQQALQPQPPGAPRAGPPQALQLPQVQRNPQASSFQQGQQDELIRRAQRQQLELQQGGAQAQAQQLQQVRQQQQAEQAQQVQRQQQEFQQRSVQMQQAQQQQAQQRAAQVQQQQQQAQRMQQEMQQRQGQAQQLQAQQQQAMRAEQQIQAQQRALQGQPARAPAAPRPAGQPAAPAEKF